MTRVMWVGSVIVVGGLVGLRRSWQRQAGDVVGCVVALILAYWQHPRMVPYVRVVWPSWSKVASDASIQQIAMVYLFVVLYGLAHALTSAYLPDDDEKVDGRRWWSGVIGAVQAGALAVLTLSILPGA